LIDTAGIRETEDPVEQEGVRRALARAADADLVLWLAHTDGAEPEGDQPAPVWLVRNKIDLHWPLANETDLESANRTFAISAARGDGLGELTAALVEFAEAFFAGQETGLITRQRQRSLLQETADALGRSLAAVDKGEELAAEELRHAAYALGRLLGRVDVEDILDVIFREFCIGK
jgi:tRNA modification GTPase